jgi:hypothetical protein
MHRLAEFWKSEDFERPPFIHSKDRGILQSPSVPNSFEQYLDRSFGSKKETVLHTCLLPEPYVGELSRADIVVVLLNPGLQVGDYFAQYVMPNGRERLLMNLRQELASEEFPHMFLDPLMCWHPGFNYWHNKFESLARELVVRGKIRNHLEALKAISRRVVTLEPFAYHSKNFGSHNLLTKLPSFIMAKEVIKNLAERAREREITVVVA